MQPVTPSATDVSVEIRIIDSGDGTPETGVTSASSGLALWYQKGERGAITDITESDLAAVDSAHSDGGMKHKREGLYRVDLPDAAIPTAEHETTTVGGAVTGMIVIPAKLVGRYGVGVAGAGLTAVAIGAGGITAASIATGAIDADALAADAVAEIADGVWDEALAGHLTAGTTGKALSDAGAAGDPWSTDLDAGGYAAGSAGDILLDLQGGTVYAMGSTPNTTADLFIRRGDTVAVTIGDLTGLAAGWDVLWVTIKRSERDADSAAILQVRLNVATPTLPGLIYINGQTPADAGVLATDAWISDVDAGADTLVLNIKPAASLLLPARGSLYWDVQQLDGTTITSLATGEKTAEIGADITRATS